MLKLRPYKPCDASEIISWIKDERALRLWSSDRFGAFPITAEDMNHKYLDCNGDCPDADNFYPMTAFDSNGIAGHLILRFTDSEKSVLRFGFIIVNDKLRGRGYGREMLKLALKYSFEVLSAERVTLGVFDSNPSAYRCYKSVGFEETGEISEALPFDGERWSVIELATERN